MKRFQFIIFYCLLTIVPVFGQGGPVPPFTTIFMRTVLDDSTSLIARTTLEILLTEFNPLLFAELSANPIKPTEGKMKLWMSDGTGFGDDGDLIIAATAGGSTKYGVLWDFSAAVAWSGENVIYAGEDVIYAGENVVY